MPSRIIGRLLTSFPLPPFVPDFFLFSKSRLVRNDNSFEILIKKKKNVQKSEGSIIERLFVKNIELVQVELLQGTKYGCERFLSL